MQNQGANDSDLRKKLQAKAYLLTHNLTYAYLKNLNFTVFYDSVKVENIDPFQ